MTCAKSLGVRRLQERPSPHDVISGERHEHRMFDVVVERVAVADALKGKSGSRWNEFGQFCVGRTKPATHLLGKEGT